MGERSLRGSRLGSVSYETERNTSPIERQYSEYRCPSGHTFTVPFADDAEVPDTWECKFDGSAAKLVGGAEPAPKKVKQSHLWVPVTMFTCLVLGVVVIAGNYLEVLPGGEVSNNFLLIGLVLLIAGFVLSTFFR